MNNYFMTRSNGALKFRVGHLMRIVSSSSFQGGLEDCPGVSPVLLRAVSDTSEEYTPCVTVIGLSLQDKGFCLLSSAMKEQPGVSVIYRCMR